MNKNEIQLPSTAFLRLSQIIGNKNAVPPVLGIIPVSRSTFLAGVKSGRYNLKPVRISERCVAYRAEEIKALIDSFGEVVRNDQ